MINIDDILFRASQCGDLMGARGLGKIGQKRARYTYLEYTTGRTKEFTSKYTDKGLKCENEAISLLSIFDEKNYSKNEVRISDMYFTGECDIISDDTILDVKNTWDLYTFNDAKFDAENVDYVVQGEVYMELYQKSNFKLVYFCLDAPDEQVLKSLEIENYKYNGDCPDWRQVQILTEMIYDKENFERFINMRGLGGDEYSDKLIDRFVHIPIEQRIYVKEYQKSDLINTIKTRVIEAREYLKYIYNGRC